MRIRERLLSVYRGETPDTVPLVLDLQHWFYHKNNKPWDISKVYEKPEYELIDYHKKIGAGFFMPNLAHFMSVEYKDDVVARMDELCIDGLPAITWSFKTPIGTIKRTRVWEAKSYSWAIKEWGVKTEEDLKVLGYVMSRRIFKCHDDKYRKWADYSGDSGLVYNFQPGYSGIGNLLNSWMGIENTMYAVSDWEDTVYEVTEQINANNLEYIEILAKSSAEVILMGDNFSGDVQPRYFFDKWTKAYYEEAIKRLHKAGKYVAVHIDGRLKGAISYIRDAGVDCIDAATPLPQGDLTPEECRDEAGNELILSGGISPCFMLPYTSEDDFKEAVLRWLDLRKRSPRLILGVGDEVPLNASEDRICMLAELVEKYGRY